MMVQRAISGVVAHYLNIGKTGTKVGHISSVVD
jgi:hypothetical protein